MTQYVKFPMNYMNITQGVNGSYSHRGLFAIDNAGKDSGKDNAFAPFDCIIKRIWNGSHTVWVESTSKVQFADGTIDYCTMSLTHDNYVADLREGQKLKQGQVFYQEGDFGNATGNHVHIEVARGKFTGNGWHQNQYGNWAINNGIDPWKAFFVNGVGIINGFGYPWKKYKEEEMVTKHGLEVIYRTNLGIAPTKFALDNFLNKVTFDEADRAVRSSEEYKQKVAEAKKTKKLDTRLLRKEFREIFGGLK